MPALRGRVGDLADLAVEGGDRGGVDADAALAALVGLVVDHRRGGEPQDVEGPDQVDLDHVVEDLEVVRRPAWRPSAGPSRSRRSRPRSAGRPRPRRRRRPPPAPARAPSRSPRRSCARSPSSAASACALVGVQVGDHDRWRRARAGARAVALAEPGGAAGDQRARSLDPHRRGTLSTTRVASRLAAERLGSLVAIAAHRRGHPEQGCDRRAPRRGARAHPPAGRAARRRAAQPRLLADPQPAGLGPRPHRQLRGALAGADGRRPRAAATASSAASTTRSRTRARPAASCRSCAATSCAPTWTRSASARSRCSTRSSSIDADDPLLARRLRLRDAARPRAPAQRDDAAAAADGRRLRARRGRRRGRRRAGRRRARDGPGRGRRARDRRRRRRASPTTTSAPATRSSCGRSGSTAPRSPTRAYAEFVEETGAEPPMYWERDGEGGWVRTAMGRTERGRPRPAGRPRLLARGRRLRALGRQAAADRARVGGGRRRAPIRERANLDQLAFGSAPAGAYADAASRLRRGADAGRRLGVDRLRLRRLPGLRGLPLPRVLRGLLRRRATRCCAAAPGRPAAT